MFNTSCGQFDGFFARIVQFGILKPEDAQCFSVEGFIEPGSIILAVSAVLLALLNTIVSKAVTQYFYDQESELEKLLFDDDSMSHLSPSNSPDQEAKEPAEQAEKHTTTTNYRIPVLFTDTFRWLLCKESQNVESGMMLNGRDESQQKVRMEQGATIMGSSSACIGPETTVVGTNEKKVKEQK